MQQFSIIFARYIIKKNIRLIKIFLFLCQFCLVVYYKPDKEHIISNTLNKLVCTNNQNYRYNYFKFNLLFEYYTILIKINTNLIKYIPYSYIPNN